MSEPVDCAVTSKDKECVLTYGALNSGSGPEDMQFTETPKNIGGQQYVVVQFTCGNLFHRSKPIPVETWSKLDTTERCTKEKSGGKEYCRRKLKKGKLDKMPDLKPYFDN